MTTVAFTLFYGLLCYWTGYWIGRLRERERINQKRAHSSYSRSETDED